MSVLQYIGARYVPKIFDDGEGGMEWRPDRYYEPLTIVSYNNASYISRVPVPSSIGNPTDNASYWALSGTFNGYVQSLDERLSFQERLNRNKQMAHWIVIGDSYSLGVLDGGGSTKSWVEMCKEALPNIQIENSGISGGGFTTSPVSFLSSLRGYAPDASVTDILVAGGYNDWNSDQNTIRAKMVEFAAYARGAFPNARVHIAYIASDYSSLNVRTSLENVVYPAYTSPGNWRVVKNCTCILRDLTGMDIVHPNADGQSWLANFFIGYIGSGSDSYTSGLISLKIGTMTCFGRIIDQSLRLYVNEGIYTEFSGFAGIYGNGVEGAEIGACEKNALYWMNNQPASEISVQGFLQSDVQSLVTGSIYTQNGKWFIKCISTGSVSGGVQFLRLGIHGCDIPLY